VNKEIRSNVIATNEEEMIVSGYALKFNSMSEDLGGFKEIISPTALSNVDFSDVRAFFDHDSSKVLGRTTSETLQLEVDDIGLKIRCKLPNNNLGRDLYESVKRGDINQMSFAFSIAENGDSFVYDKEQGIYIRTLNKIKSIQEVSIVSIPAYSDTTIAVAIRNLEQAKEQRQREILLLEIELLDLEQ